MASDPFKIVVTGPESTGKTELAESLAAVLHADLIPEYARSYVENLNRPYTYRDVEHIARMQEQELDRAIRGGKPIIVLDTYLVITKIWFREVYRRIPDWIDPKLKATKIDLFLLCYYDLEWVSDPVRENPGERRQYLFELYRKEIERLGTAFATVKGQGKERFDQARRSVLKHYSDIEKRSR